MKFQLTQIYKKFWLTCLDLPRKPTFICNSMNHALSKIPRGSILYVTGTITLGDESINLEEEICDDV